MSLILFRLITYNKYYCTIQFIYEFDKTIYKYTLMLFIFLHLSLLMFATQNKLQLVFSLNRHGSRYHITQFFDSNQTQPLKSELTATGMRQLERLGQLLRKEYIDNLKFLSPHYNPKEIEAFTSQTNRTYTSLQSLFYGLYPPGTGPTLPCASRELHMPPYSNNSDIKQQKYALPKAYQPIIIRFRDDIEFEICKNEQEIGQKEQKRHPKIIPSLNKTYSNFFQRMSTIFNFSLSNFTLQTFSRCYETASVDLFLGRSMPQDFTDQDYQKLLYLTNQYNYLIMKGIGSKIKNTLKFKRIIENFDKKINYPNASPLKWTFISGHDYDFVAMCQAFQFGTVACSEQLFRRGHTNEVCEQDLIKYGATLIIELHSDKQKKYFVKIRSNGKYIKICSKKLYECNYDQFREIALKNMGLEDLNRWCGQEIIKSEQVKYWKKNHTSSNLNF